MTILSFPIYCWMMQATIEIRKDSKSIPVYFAGAVLEVTAPIDIKPMDLLMVDIRNGHLELFQRAGIVIWREAWKN